jgi:hypothetical protein
MPHRDFCCNDLPPKGLVVSMGSIAVLLGLSVLAFGYGLIPLELEWVRAPRWVVMGAGLLFIVGGIAITLVTLPAHRRERQPQA